jgi:hypothetical protein
MGRPGPEGPAPDSLPGCQRGTSDRRDPGDGSQKRPKNTFQWLAFVGFLRYYPPGSVYGSFDSHAFTCLIRLLST